MATHLSTDYAAGTVCRQWMLQASLLGDSLAWHSSMSFQPIRHQPFRQPVRLVGTDQSRDPERAEAPDEGRDRPTVHLSSLNDFAVRIRRSFHVDGHHQFDSLLLRTAQHREDFSDQPTLLLTHLQLDLDYCRGTAGDGLIGTMNSGATAATGAESGDWHGSVRPILQREGTGKRRTRWAGSKVVDRSLTDHRHPVRQEPGRQPTCNASRKNGETQAQQQHSPPTRRTTIPGRRTIHGVFVRHDRSLATMRAQVVNNTVTASFVLWVVAHSAAAEHAFRQANLGAADLLAGTGSLCTAGSVGGTWMKRLGEREQHRTDNDAQYRGKGDRPI